MQEKLYEEMYELEEKHWWFKSKREIILKLIAQNISPNATIVDCGCGCGYLLTCLELYGRVKGIDFSETALTYSAKNFKGELMQGDLQQQLPLDLESVDMAVALDVIEHLEDDEKGIENIKHILKVGGKAIITVPAFGFLWSYHDEEHMHKRRYSIKEMKKLLMKSGFSIDYISYYNFWLFIPICIARFLKKNVVSHKSDANMPNKYVNGVLEKIFSSEMIFINRRIKLPFGVSIVVVATKK